MKGNDAAVLHELASGDWLVGLDIVDRIQARKDLDWWTKLWSWRSSVYVILYRLENDGLVKSRVMGAVKSPGWPSRKEYQIVDQS